uniref:Uncharacterized protein n=1 Tax=Kwoniella pini CBS 10737 TaxID=1296096 RepID=A0A1B9I135_9TREE|nr:uncharacterized protein I206_04937 [Kwoniella pini CBS 10737]OCF49249.1 hypothetical protein I206_04937 [Kwoniella pini CBS 10737]
MAESKADKSLVFLAFGNNVCGNLDPAGPSILRQPTEVKHDCKGIEWTSWACTVGKDPLRIWGTDPLVHDKQATVIALTRRLKRVVGFDRPQAFLLDDGRVQDIEGRLSCRSWDDVIITELGTTFECLKDLMQETNAQHPIPGLPQNSSLTSLQLTATESRAFVLVNGPAQLIYEIKDVKVMPPKSVKTSEPVILDYIADLEASGVGADSETVVTDQNIYVRGSSEFINIDFR